MKSREQKERIVKSMSERLRNAPGVILTGYKGLTVAQVSKLRSELRPLGASFTVLKNTLARIASRGTAYEEIMEKLDGPRAATLLGGDPSSAIKVLIRAVKDMAGLELIEGMVEGNRLDPAGLKAFSELPSLDGVRAIFAGLLQTSLANFVSVLAAPGRDMVGILKVYADKLETNLER